MIEARAIVVAVAQGRAKVRISENMQGCGRCDEPGGCRSVKLTHALGVPEQEFTLEDRLGLQPGDRVKVVMQEGGPLLGALASYGLAVLLVLLGAALGHVLASETTTRDLSAAVGMLGGLVLAVLINRLLQRSRGWRQRIALELVRDESSCTLKPMHTA
ncbi:MAG: SoxR reducing system RseC family protein [Rhodocyclaceae bacterium]|jgi:sigma-E factor negative regulatory protein RseC|nr:SoxR reducing system RseC family protein [Rhodocyclaceae bacterium]